LQRVAACCSVLQCIKPSDVYAMHQSSDENGMHRKNIPKKKLIGCIHFPNNYGGKFV